MNLRHVHPCCDSQRGVAATYFVLPCSYTSPAPKHAEIGWFSVVVGLFLFFYGRDVFIKPALSSLLDSGMIVKSGME